MDIINQRLSELIAQDAQSKFKVLIVTKPGTPAEELNLTEYKHLMDNILSATITGEKVLSLAHQKAVNSIELDTDMSVL